MKKFLLMTSIFIVANSALTACNYVNTGQDEFGQDFEKVEQQHQANNQDSNSSDNNDI